MDLGRLRILRAMFIGHIECPCMEPSKPTSPQNISGAGQNQNATYNFVGIPITMCYSLQLA